MNPTPASVSKPKKMGQMLVGTGAEGPLPPELWPNVDHLVTEDDTLVDNIYSEKQQRLLTESLYASWPGPGNGRPFVAFANVGLYHYIKQEPLAPDVMMSLDVELPEDIWEKRHRSYMIWEYGKPPEVVIEIVSNKIGDEDTEKPLKYARMGVAYYIVYDPYQNLSEQVLRCYALNQTSYVQMAEAWLPAVELGLTIWQGEFEKWEDSWLRWCDREGNVLLTGQESAKRERQRAEQAEQRAEQAEEKLKRLVEQLRSLGVEPTE